MEIRRDSLLLLVGPTAVGKTDFSLRVARQLGGEIVSADSRQIYRYMDIGTAKPSLEQRSHIPHHFIDVIAPDEQYSAGEYGRQSREVIDDLFRQGTVPIVVGGSGLYIRALVDGFFDPSVYEPEVRERLRQRLRKVGAAALHAELMRVDPEAGGRIHPHDSQRIVRALEVYEITGRSLSDLQKGSEGNRANLDPLFIGLTMPRAELYRRIDRRVDDMIERGLVEEVRQLSQLGYDRSLNSMQTVGYQEIFAHLEGEISLEEAVRLIKRNSRHYAKRQLTWFRKDPRVRWLELRGGERVDPIVERIVDIYQERMEYRDDGVMG